MSVLLGYVSALSLSALNCLDLSEGATPKRATVAVYADKSAVPGGQSAPLFAGDPELQVAADIQKCAQDLREKLRKDAEKIVNFPHSLITEDDLEQMFPDEWKLTAFALGEGNVRKA